MIYDLIQKLNASSHFKVPFSAVDIKFDDWIDIKLHYLNDVGYYPTHRSEQRQKQIDRGKQLNQQRSWKKRIKL